jgi:hypothetical protein
MTPILALELPPLAFGPYLCSMLWYVFVPLDVGFAVHAARPERILWTIVSVAASDALGWALAFGLGAALPTSVIMAGLDHSDGAGWGHTEHAAVMAFTGWMVFCLVGTASTGLVLRILRKRLGIERPWRAALWAHLPGAIVLFTFMGMIA